MRANGTFEAYESRIMYANAISRVKESINELESFQSTLSNPQIHFSDGRFEEWKVGTKKIKEDLQIEIDKLEGRLVELQQEVKDMEAE